MRNTIKGIIVVLAVVSAVILATWWLVPYYLNQTTTTIALSTPRPWFSNGLISDPQRGVTIRSHPFPYEDAVGRSILIDEDNNVVVILDKDDQNKDIFDLSGASLNDATQPLVFSTSSGSNITIISDMAVAFTGGSTETWLLAPNQAQGLRQALESKQDGRFQPDSGLSTIDVIDWMKAEKQKSEK